LSGGRLSGWVDVQGVIVPVLLDSDSFDELSIAQSDGNSTYFVRSIIIQYDVSAVQFYHHHRTRRKQASWFPVRLQPSVATLVVANTCCL